MNGWQTKQIKRALDQAEILTEWEYEFINSLAENSARELSKKQNEILNRIAQKLR